MTFANPALLWSLAALLPLGLVYLLKVRPRTRPTTAFFLWEQVLEDKKPNRLWDQLKNVISLLMMAAAFGAIGLAAAGPRFAEEEATDLLLVVDNSLSMSADAGGTTRLGLAKDEARRIARAMDGTRRVAVATAAARLRYVSYLSDNPREILAAIDTIGPTFEALDPSVLPSADGSDSSTDEGEDRGQTSPAEPDAAEGDRDDAVVDTPARRVLFLTDGLRDDLPVGVDPFVVGGRAKNVGLVAADLQFAAGDDTRLQLYVQTASTHERPIEVDLLISREDDDGGRELARVVPLEVSPGVNEPRVLTVEGASAGRWVAELDTAAAADGDALAADDTAYLVATAEPPVAIGVKAGDYFFGRAVEAFSGGGGGLVTAAGGAAVDVTLAAGDPGEAASAIVFAPSGGSAFWASLGDELDVVAPRVVADDHPVLRDIDPLSIAYVGSRELTPPAGSEVLVASADGVPLIYVTKGRGRSAVVVNLEPAEAEFFYSAWFPVLVRASARHLVGRAESLRATYPPGADVVIPGGEEMSGSFFGPDGVEVPVVGGRLDALAVPGFYKWRSSPSGGSDETERPLTVACGTQSATETLLPAGGSEGETAGTGGGRGIGHWLVVAAVLCVTAESVLYHRRKIG